MSAFSQVTGTVDRLLGLGAKISDDHRTSDGDGWVVLLDPAGNEFCMTRSAVERQSRGAPGGPGALIMHD